MDITRPEGGLRGASIVWVRAGQLGADLAAGAGRLRLIVGVDEVVADVAEKAPLNGHVRSPQP